MALNGKTFIVTGTSRGLGAETARRMQAQGARVIGLDKNETTEHVDHYIPLDLADATAIDGAVEQLKAYANGTIHGLCNIAGVAPTLPPPLVVQINFLGTRYFTESVEPLLADDGSIVHVASGTALGWPRNIDKYKALAKLSLGDDIGAFCEEHEIDKANSYAFSKEAIIAWTTQRWKKWEDRQIRMNTVSPGPIETPLLPDFISDMVPADAPMFEMSRNATPDEVADVILFLSDEGSRWINAADIPVDGGLQAVVKKRIHQF